MKKAQRIFVTANFESGDSKSWAFSLGATGVLDYCGVVENEELAGIDEGKRQILCGSAYFTPSWYGFLPASMHASFAISLLKDDVYEKNLLAFLTHIGPVLLAIENGDTFLAVELVKRRFDTFMAFQPIMLYLFEPIAFAGLLAWAFGRLDSDGNIDSVLGFLIEALGEPFQKLIREEGDLTKAVCKSFEQRSLRGFSFTAPLVGLNFQEFISVYGKVCEQIDTDVAKALVRGDSDPSLSGVKGARERIFGNLSANLQVEPFNPHDRYAIGVRLDDPRAPLCGKGSTLKAGYLRSMLAKIIREALPKTLAFQGKLVRIGGTGFNPKQAVIVQVDIA